MDHGEACGRLCVQDAAAGQAEQIKAMAQGKAKAPRWFAKVDQRERAGGPADFLLQIDSDDRIDLEVGDVKAIAVALAPKRLTARDFRGARASLAAE